MRDGRESRQRYYRHPLPVRIAHWLNALCLFVLLLSGLQIFNAHAALYWGAASDFDDPWLSIGATLTPEGPRGRTEVLGRSFDTGGVLGTSGDAAAPEQRAFPTWLTIPGPRWLAMGRRWHFFFAWLLVINAAFYLAWSTASGHLRRLWPGRVDWRRLGLSLRDHLLLRHASGEAATRYNILQKLAYLAVIFGLGPLIVLTGLCMSPRMDTVLEPLLDLFGGRQSARSLHFLAAAGFVLFALVHVFQVLVSGPWNNLRSMITGHYDYRAAPGNRRRENRDDRP